MSSAAKLDKKNGEQPRAAIAVEICSEGNISEISLSDIHPLLGQPQLKTRPQSMPQLQPRTLAYQKPVDIPIATTLSMSEQATSTAQQALSAGSVLSTRLQTDLAAARRQRNEVYGSACTDFY